MFHNLMHLNIFRRCDVLHRATILCVLFELEVSGLVCVYVALNVDHSAGTDRCGPCSYSHHCT